MGFLRKTFKKIGKGIKSLTKKFAKFMSSDIGKFISLAAMVMMTGGAFGIDMFGKKGADSAGQKIAEETIKEEVAKEGAEKVASEAAKQQIATNLTGESLAQAARDKGLLKDVMKDYALDSYSEAALNTISNSNVLSNSLTTTFNTAASNPIFQANANTVIGGGKVPLDNSWLSGEIDFLKSGELDVVKTGMKNFNERETLNQIVSQSVDQSVQENLAKFYEPKGLFGGLKKGVGDFKIPFTGGEDGVKLTFGETGPGQFISESVPLGKGMLETSPAEYYAGGTFIASQLADKPKVDYGWGMDTSAAYGQLSNINTPTLYGTSQPLNAPQLMSNNTFMQDYSNSVSNVLNQNFSPFNIQTLANANVYGNTLPISARANVINAYNRMG